MTHELDVRTPAPRSVTDYLEGDHRRLDAILPEVRRSMAAGSFEEAGARFAGFISGLGRHIDLEEQILFPAFEELTGMTAGGPTFVMRNEHVEIRRFMEAVAAALGAADAAGAGASLDGLTEALGAHNMKEERVLYPMIDRAAGDDRARENLVERLRSF